MNATRVRVPERGGADVDAETWSMLRSEPDFQLLLDKGILTALHLPGGRAKLRGGCFVGHALCGDVRLEIHEKIPGALLALVQYARKDAFQVISGDAQATEIGPLLSELIKQFLLLVSVYVIKGRKFTYSNTRRTAPLGGGRLDMVRTLSLRARGMTHLLAFDRPQVSFNTPLNMVIAACLREIENLSKVIHIEDRSIAAARGFSLMFGDTGGWLSRRTVEVAETASMLAKEAESEDIADMLSLGRVILAHQSFEPERFLNWRLPRTWFINLELLFEQSIRITMARLLGQSGREVINGRKHSAQLFAAGTALYQANPDIAVRHGGQTVYVGDVKYKDFDGKADQSDIYQLLAHAAAFHAGQCLLFYPGEEFALIDLGNTADGRHVHIVVVQVQKLEASLNKLISSLFLGESPKLAA